MGKKMKYNKKLLNFIRDCSVVFWQVSHLDSKQHVSPLRKHFSAISVWERSIQRIWRPRCLSRARDPSASWLLCIWAVSCEYDQSWWRVLHLVQADRHFRLFFQLLHCLNILSKIDLFIPNKLVCMNFLFMGFIMWIWSTTNSRWSVPTKTEKTGVFKQWS